jgi:hypothetical protein
MAISDDLKRLHLVLADVPTRASDDTARFMRMVRANLLALAEQVEALEHMPLHVERAGRRPVCPAPLQ